MPTDFDYTQLPQGYAFCLYDECPQAGQCLRHALGQDVPAETTYIHILSPAAARKAAARGSCSHFRPIETCRFGRGIERLLKQVEKLPCHTAHALRNAIYGYFGRNKFYRIRHGERLVLPEEQEEIAALFRKAGIEEAPCYDEYIEQYDFR